MRAHTFRGAQFLAIGLTIGVALTFVVMHTENRTQKSTHPSASNTQPHIAAEKKLIAERPQSPAAGAASAQESKPLAEQQQAAPVPSRWLTPADVIAEQQAAQRAANPTPSGPPRAPKYQSSNTTYYVYNTSPEGVPLVPSQQELTTTVSGYEIPVGSGPKAVDYPMTEPGPWTMGTNGLLQNPCVDPPSTRGRAYTYAAR